MIDVFLVNSQVAKGGVNLCQQVGGKVANMGVLIKKTFQGGKKSLNEKYEY